ncbi:MAG: MBL fold metallo-hydrolase [Deltaproteobacteria bacterium]|nr:MBL fold metallo-hydrolase [Deltaproteobacteria bacterium]
MKIRFWGVRGSVASSGPATRKIGGNTTCVEVESQGERLILDAGTGVRALGDHLLEAARQGDRRVPIEASFLFTHLHWDHIQGFPFFAPAYVPGTELTLYGPSEAAGGSEEPMDLRGALARQMEAPNFPVPLEAMGADKRFRDLDDGDRLALGPFEILTRRLEHPQGCLGYRIEAEGHSVCFATDTEHRADGELDEALLQLARGVDLLIYDAQYTPDEYEGTFGPSRRGWGHSTHEAAARIARACGAKTLALFHHDPTHDDAFVARMERDARGLFPWTRAAREGEVVRF